MSLRVVDLRGRATGRLIIVGDIHGCLNQLRDLLVKVDFTNACVRRCPSLLTPPSASSLSTDDPLPSCGGCPNMCIPAALNPDPWPGSASPSTEDGEMDDVCVFVGDLVNKGADSYGVVRFLRDIGAIGVLGNHDVMLLQLSEKLRADVPLTDKEANSSLYPLALHCPNDVFAFMASVPHILCFHAYQLIVVHAGIDPSIALAAQSVEAVIRMRNLVKAKKYSMQPTDEATGQPAHVALSVSDAFASLERSALGASWGMTWSKLACKLHASLTDEEASDGDTGRRGRHGGAVASAMVKTGMERISQRRQMRMHLGGGSAFIESTLILPSCTATTPSGGCRCIRTPTGSILVVSTAAS
ncbi:bis(5'-nucleosyl)-tetraphosphatase,symmetrical-li keprotein [Leishmania tarentolae]|uniref:Bis(5'-nucleosyl)-tetraphosphatase, symmetrical-li keprotein n=1 Tax=Leishmania tarentolae TaxID=5689 RepID=A0A640KDF5_LEITA|nr:bis(5'-nucleosyl)-tetraphosphatase,symmetrical-li keprotein [Leishmania tarentolae]